MVLWYAHGVVQSGVCRLASALSIGRTLRVNIVVMKRVVVDAVVASIVLDQGICEVRRHVVLVAEKGCFVLDLAIRRASELLEVIGGRCMADIVIQRVTLTFVSQGCHGWRVCLCYVWRTLLCRGG
jgi:hypothetical protein